MKHTLSLLSLAIILLFSCHALGRASAAPAKTSRLYYTGTIGKMAVQMDLAFSNNLVEGDYWYEANPEIYDALGVERNTLEVKGTLSTSGQVMLMEKDPNEKKTGVITGAFTNTSTHFTGMWCKPDHTHALPITLRAVARYISISRVDQKQGIECTAIYPQLLASGLPYSDVNVYLHAKCLEKMNAFVAGCLEDGNYRDANHDYSQDYSVSLTYFSARFISLLVEDETYTSGVHPETDYDTFNLALKPKYFSSVLFKDLFNSESLKKLAHLLTRKVQSVNKARAQSAFYFTNDWKLDQHDIGNIMLMPAGAVFSFAPGAISSYADGSYFVTVPYAELAGLMNNNDDLPSFVKAAK